MFTMEYVEVDFDENPEYLGGWCKTENIAIAFDGVKIWQGCQDIKTWGNVVINDGYSAGTEIRMVRRVVADANKLLARGVTPEEALIAAFAQYYGQSAPQGRNVHPSVGSEVQQLIEKLRSSNLVFEGEEYD